MKSASNWDSGYLVAGIVNWATGVVYAAKRVDCFTNMTVLTLSANRQGIPLVLNDQLIVYVLNITNNAYVSASFPGDVLRFIARKTK